MEQANPVVNPPPETENRAGRFDVLLFELRGRRCALPTQVVLEVVPLGYVTPVPLTGTAVRGVIPIHGQPLALVDLSDLVSPLQAMPDSNGNDLSVRPPPTAALVVQALVPPETTPVRAAIAVDRVLRVCNAERFQGPDSQSPGAAFSSAVVHDADGPALLLDVGAALAQVMDRVRGLANRPAGSAFSRPRRPTPPLAPPGGPPTEDLA